MCANNQRSAYSASIEPGSVKGADFAPADTNFARSIQVSLLQRAHMARDDLPRQSLVALPSPPLAEAVGRILPVHWFATARARIPDNQVWVGAHLLHKPSDSSTARSSAARSRHRICAHTPTVWNSSDRLEAKGRSAYVPIRFVSKQACPRMPCRSPAAWRYRIRTL
jgi:hypothetical protein